MPIRIVPRDADRIQRRCDRDDLATGGARLFKGAHFAFADIDRNTQHVAEGGEDDLFGSASWIA